jgi:hypothetical protein
MFIVMITKVLLTPAITSFYRLFLPVEVLTNVPERLLTIVDMLGQARDKDREQTNQVGPVPALQSYKAKDG